MQDIRKEIEAIKQRNIRVEIDKAREISRTRRIYIALLTYIVIVIFFYTMKSFNPWVNAIVPTIGFVVSTLSLGFFKTLRIKHKGTNKK